MSEEKVQQTPGLTEEQIQAVSGGGCTPEQIVSITRQLTAAYENLVDFTSHVIERVAK